MSVIIHPLDEPPDFLALHQHYSELFPFLLESVAHGNTQNRFDILFACPQDELLAYGSDTHFLNQLDEAWRAELSELDCDLPFSGGWFLFLSYELAAEIEPTLKLPADDTFPVACATRCPMGLIRNTQTGECYLVVETQYKNLSDRVFAAINDCPGFSFQNYSPSELIEDPPEDYLEAIGIIRNYIKSGDVFQVNLSRQWLALYERAIDPASIYSVLKKNNPAPFAGIAKMGKYSILSSSPERLVKVRGNRVETRPIAGTRPRGTNSIHDEKLWRELLAHPKERAEHVMLIDLVRNDLGRVCQFGSMDVNEMMTLEKFAHVQHIVSNVRGELNNHTTPGQIIAAVFPGGTITGCPKVRCMEIIAELEQTPRGAYTGAFGYLNRNASMDLNILIRTLCVESSKIKFRAGAGIVADSMADQELNEAHSKAKGLLASLDTTRETV